MDKEKNYLSTNLKYLRQINQKSLVDVANVCEKTNVAVHYWEDGTREPNAVDIAKLANFFQVSIDDLILKDLRINNGRYIEVNPTSDTIKMPVLGSIKAGIPMEAQQDIVDYIDIPKNWANGGKTLYGLIINGNSMYPKYMPKDIIVVEQNEDLEYANNKDCVVMVNGDDATFKKFNFTHDGIILTPLNPYNDDGFSTTFYNAEQIEKLPVKVIGVAIKKISDIEY